MEALVATTFISFAKMELFLTFSDDWLNPEYKNPVSIIYHSCPNLKNLAKSYILNNQFQNSRP